MHLFRWLLCIHGSLLSKANESQCNILLPCDRSDGKPRCIDFYYRMICNGKGFLNITVEYSGIKYIVFNATSSNANGWNRGQAVLDIPSGINFTVGIKFDVNFFRHLVHGQYVAL